jgi:hypothetical protein
VLVKAVIMRKQVFFSGQNYVQNGAAQLNFIEIFIYQSSIARIHLICSTITDSHAILKFYATE